MASPNSSNTNDSWQGSYVYYERFDGSNATKYCVLDASSNSFGVANGSLFLDCDSALYNKAFKWNGGSGITWQNSDVQTSLIGNDFLNKTGYFTPAEKAAIALSKTNMSGNYTNLNINGEQIFVLDKTEAENATYGYSCNSSRIKNGSSWWYRTPSQSTPGSVMGCTEDGQHSHIPASYQKGVSPAFNINLDSIVFSSLLNPASNKKYEEEFKLTLKDSNTSLMLGEISRDDDIVTIPYTVTDNDESDGIIADTVSVLILESDNTIKYYAPLTGAFAMTGSSGTFDVPTYFDATCDFVYILAEDTHEGNTSKYLTDYASEMVEITIPENHSISPEIKNISLTLADDLALNFYVNGINDTNAEDYKIKFSGDCMENKAALTKNVKTGQYYAAAHVTARNTSKKITDSLCKDDVVIDTADPFSVTDYLESAPKKLGLDITQMSGWTAQQQNTYAMIAATQLFCDAASDYFNDTSQFEASYEAFARASGKTEGQIDDALTEEAVNYPFKSDDNVFIALSLKNKTRIYIYEGDEIKYTIENLLPHQLTQQQTAGEYTFYGLSWADRVFKKGTAVSQKNLNMAKAVTAYALAAAAYAG